MAFLKWYKSRMVPSHLDSGIKYIKFINTNFWAKSELRNEHFWNCYTSQDEEADWSKSLLTLTMEGSVKTSLRMYISLRSSSVSMTKSSSLVDICIKQANPRKLLYEWCWWKKMIHNHTSLSISKCYTCFTIVWKSQDKIYTKTK